MKLLSTLIFLLVSLNSFSQFELNGKIVDSQTNKPLEGVHIKFEGIDNELNYYAVSKISGDFWLKGIEKGEYELSCTYIGYQPYRSIIDLSENKQINILLEKQLVNIGEAVVTSLRQGKKIKEVAVPMQIVDKSQIDVSSSFTAADVLNQEPGVELSRDGVWATGISIRGLGQQRIVMLVDGNRIETATDLMASLSFFDVDDIQRIEVIKGASSSLYGSGAMGGIVHIITQEPAFSSDKYFKGTFYAGHSTVNKLFTRKLKFETGSKKWFASISGSMRDAKDINTPEGRIENSQFEDQSLSANLGYRVKNNQIIKFNYQYFDADDVGIPGGSAFPGPATAKYTDAKRWLTSVNYEISDISDQLTRLNFKYFHQYIVRDVSLIPNTANETESSITTPEKITPSGEHTTDGIQIQSDWIFGKSNSFILGLDTWRRKLETSRQKYIRVDLLDSEGNITVTNNIVRGETPIPESCFGSAGLYFQDEQNFFDDDLKITLGGRLDGISIANKEALSYDYLIMNGSRNDTPPNQRITFEENEEYKISWSANLGLLYALTNTMDLSFSAGRSFRAPSLEESFKYIDLGNLVRLGDPGLDPEKGYTTNVGLRIWKPKFQFQLDGFVHWLSNMIVEKPDEFVYFYTTGILDTIPALINTNVDQARLYGFDFNFQYNFYKDMVLHGAGSYVKGEDTKNNTDLPLIPPMNGRLGIKYTLPNLFGLDMVAIGYADQDQVADGEMQTKGYARFDLALNSSVIVLDYAKIQFFGGIENIGDRAYTNHLATNRGSISIEPGRNFYIKMKVLF